MQDAKNRDIRVVQQPALILGLALFETYAGSRVSFLFIQIAVLLPQLQSLRTRLNIGDEDCNLTVRVVDEKALEYCEPTNNNNKKKRILVQASINSERFSRRHTKTLIDSTTRVSSSTTLLRLLMKMDKFGFAMASDWCGSKKMRAARRCATFAYASISQTRMRANFVLGKKRKSLFASNFQLCTFSPT